MRLGGGLCLPVRARLVVRAGQGVTTVDLSGRSCGWRDQALSVGCCRLSSASGTASISGSTAGAAMACGSAFSLLWPTVRIGTTYWWTAPSSALTSTAQAPLKGGRSEEHTYELQSLMRISYAVF